MMKPATIYDEDDDLRSSLKQKIIYDLESDRPMMKPPTAYNLTASGSRQLT